ncbi:MAG: tRNA epoxyqueuosine(34) reductase QueG [Phycisphaerales bacterium JB040]
MSARDTTQRILDTARQRHGFALAGVASLEPSAYADEFHDWLARGRQGEMGYLAKNLDLRLDPASLLAGARSAIVVGDLYATRSDNRDAPLGAGEGRIARYARGRDYHTVIKKRLHALADGLASDFPGDSFRACVDTAPVLERELAARAGLGWTAKHTLVIHPREGSYLLLGVLLTSLELEPNPKPEPDHCGTCTRCIEACPTDAITPYSVDATRCLSYLTIEHRGPIEPDAFDFAGWVYGCDVCQEVCPHNSERATGATVPSAYDARRDRFDLLEVLGWSEADRREAFTTSAMKRATLAMMKRNALILLGQGGLEGEALARVRAVAADESEPDLVRATAREVLGRSV